MTTRPALGDFIDAVAEMRDAQKVFFAARRADSETRQAAVIDAKQKERAVDRMLITLRSFQSEPGR